MKAPFNNSHTPTKRLDRFASPFARIKQASSRNVSLVATGLIVLLLLDAGFVLWRSAHPSAQPARADAAQTTASHQRQVAVEPHIGASLSDSPSQAVAARPQSSSPTTAKVAAAPRTRYEKLLTEDEMAQVAVEPTPSACHQLSGQIVTETIQSKVLGMPLLVHLYLPPCYDPQKYTYPSIYLIRGTDGYGNWVKMGLPETADIQISLGLLPPFIAVLPATDEGSYRGGKYIYSSSGQSSWEGFILDELMPFVEQNYSVWQDRAGRAIGGISRGGYWSIEIAFQHPELFSAVGGHSPSITSDMLIGTPAGFSMLSLAQSAESLKSLRIELDAGANDWAQKGVNKLSADLDAQGIPYSATSGEGIHDDNYWSSRLTDYLTFYAATWPRIARAKPVQIGSAAGALPSQP